MGYQIPVITIVAYQAVCCESSMTENGKRCEYIGTAHSYEPDAQVEADKHRAEHVAHWAKLNEQWGEGHADGVGSNG